MAKKIDFPVSETKQEKNLQEYAEKIYQTALNGLYQSRKGVLIFASAMKEIRDKKLYHRYDYETFEELCCSPEISVMPKTVNEYIGLYEFWIERQKKNLDEMAGIEVNKLRLLKRVKKPEKFFHEAKTLAWTDFKKTVLQKEFKLDPEDNEVQDYIKRNHPCPNWNGEKCAAGVKIPKPAKKSNRGLI